MHGAYLLLGTNLGDRKAQLNQALQHIETRLGKIMLCSAIYETAAWGNEEQPAFYNCVCKIETGFNPHELLSEMLKLEQEMGRTRGEIQYLPRTIDIDILFYDDVLLHDETLVIPHPRLHLRRFTLIPLFEISPELIHPKFKMTIRELLSVCEDNLEVVKV